MLTWVTSLTPTAAETLWYRESSYLDVDLDVESLRLAVSIADVEAEDVMLGLSFVLAVLDVEDVVRRQVLHRERHIRGDDPRAANRASWWTETQSSEICFPVSGIFLHQFCTKALRGKWEKTNSGDPLYDSDLHLYESFFKVPYFDFFICETCGEISFGKWNFLFVAVILISAPRGWMSWIGLKPFMFSSRWGLIFDCVLASYVTCHDFLLAKNVFLLRTW